MKGEVVPPCLAPGDLRREESILPAAQVSLRLFNTGRPLVLLTHLRLIGLQDIVFSRMGLIYSLFYTEGLLSSHIYLMMGNAAFILNSGRKDMLEVSGLGVWVLLKQSWGES